MNDTVKASVRQGRARVLAILASGALLGSALAFAPAVAGAAGADSGAAAPAVAGAAVVAGSASVTTCDPISTTTATNFTLTVGVPGGSGQVTSVAIQSSGSDFTVDTAGPPATVVPDGNLLVTDMSLTTGTASFSFTAMANISAAANWTIDFETGTGPNEDNALSDPTAGGDDVQTMVSTTSLSCHLAFTVQPTSTTKNTVITNTPGDPTASKVAVQVEDGSGNPVLVATGVTLILNGGNVGLSGGTDTPTGTSGLATFPGLYDSNSGLNLTLTATADDSAITPAPSNKFTIYDIGTLCTPITCPPVIPATGFSVAATGGGFLAASVNPISLSCSALKFGLYPGIPGTTVLGFSFTGSSPKTVQLFVAKSLLGTVRAKLLSLYYMVCFTAPAEFQTVFKLPAALDPATTALLGQNYYTGLLPDCKNTSNTPPCVVSRVWGATGLTVTVLAPAGDPFGR